MTETQIATGEQLWQRLSEKDGFLRPAEVAVLLRVSASTVTRWCDQGKLAPDDYIRTPGRQRLIRAAAIRRILWPDGPPVPVPAAHLPDVLPVAS